MTDAPFFHVGVLVADIDAAIRRFSDMLGLTFAPVMEAPIQLRGTDHDVDLVMKATYSREGPPHIELVQGQHDDGIFSLRGGERLHHLGTWSPSLEARTNSDPHLCLPTLYMVHQVPGQPPGMCLTDPAALHGAVMEFVDESGRPMLDAWISGRPPDVGCVDLRSAARPVTPSCGHLTRSLHMAEPIVLFDGRGLGGWRMAGPGSFELVNDVLETRGGMGLLWYSAQAFTDFVLDVDWQVVRLEDNSGVFVRFPDPGDNPWVAVNEGYEIQIHDTAPEPIHQTGGIYSFAAPSLVASNPPGIWNHYSIECVGQQYVIVLNGVEVTRFTGTRGTEGYVGLQNHDTKSLARFRRVAITELGP